MFNTYIHTYSVCVGSHLGVNGNSTLNLQHQHLKSALMGGGTPIFLVGCSILRLLFMEEHRPDSGLDRESVGKETIRQSLFPLLSQSINY